MTNPAFDINELHKQVVISPVPNTAVERTATLQDEIQKIDEIHSALIAQRNAKLNELNTLGATVALQTQVPATAVRDANKGIKFETAKRHAMDKGPVVLGSVIGFLVALVLSKVISDAVYFFDWLDWFEGTTAIIMVILIILLTAIGAYVGLKIGKKKQHPTTQLSRTKETS
jgi:uncharacterized protein YacL